MVSWPANAREEAQQVTGRASHDTLAAIMPVPPDATMAMSALATQALPSAQEAQQWM